MTLYRQSAVAFAMAITVIQAAPGPGFDGRKIRIDSKILGESREILVRLPSGYESGPERFPLLIQLGGEAHFPYTVAVTEFLSRGDHIPRLIVAAILDPTPMHHYRDSTPTKVAYLPASGGAGRFLGFIKDELVPALDAEFRTRPLRILCGHGLSGLFAVHALLESPGTFAAFITDGASLTYDGSAILDRAALRLTDPAVRGKLYLGVGNEMETAPGLASFAVLLDKSAPDGLEWKTETFADEDQGTASLPTLYHGLKWVFRSWRIPVAIATQGMDAVKAYYRDLSAKLGYEIPVTEKILSTRGFQLIREQRFDEALVLLDINAGAFPESPNAYHSLAVLSERRRQWERAASFYETAARKAERADPELARFFRMQAGQARGRAGKKS